jgi:hypothetical protein
VSIAQAIRRMPYCLHGSVQRKPQSVTRLSHITAFLPSVRLLECGHSPSYARAAAVRFPGRVPFHPWTPNRHRETRLANRRPIASHKGEIETQQPLLGSGLDRGSSGHRGSARGLRLVGVARIGRAG